MMNRLTSICFIVLIVASSFISSTAQDTPKVITGGFLNGKAVHLPAPEYPAEAIKGIVFVDVVIDESGTVISAFAAPQGSKIESSDDADRTEHVATDQRLRAAAEKAALEAKFSPTLLSGQPVKVMGTLVYTFAVNSPSADVNGGILNGKATSLPKPAYPDAAKAVRASGPVAVRIVVDENGDVIEAVAISGHPLLRSAAVEAAKIAKFAPTRLSGQPVKVSGVLAYNFVVPKKEETN